jgi:hypothetical protein
MIRAREPDLSEAEWGKKVLVEDTRRALGGRIDIRNSLTSNVALGLSGDRIRGPRCVRDIAVRMIERMESGLVDRGLREHLRRKRR